jgi:hypothetical protein
MTNEGDLLVLHEKHGSSWWKTPMVWTTLLIASYLIYEVTAKPVLGVLLLCSKFGWNDLLIGYWLRQMDPNRARGKTFFWFLLGTGLINVTIAAGNLCLLLSVVFVVFKAQQRAAPFPAEILVALAVWGAGVFLALLAVLLGFWNAFRAQLRIWLSYPLFWPREAGKDNMAHDFLAMAIFLLGFIGFCIITFLAVALDRGGRHVWITSCLLVVSIGVMTTALLRLFFVLKRRLIAQHPSECWGQDFIGAIMVSQMPNWRKWRMLARTQSEIVTQIESPD